jgi:hypothetical protein
MRPIRKPACAPDVDIRARLHQSVEVPGKSADVMRVPKHDANLDIVGEPGR